MSPLSVPPHWHNLWTSLSGPPPSSRKPGNALRSQSDFNRSNPHTQQEKNSLSASLPRNPQIHRLPLARTGSRVHVWANNCTGSLTSPNWLRPIRAHLRRYRQNSSHPNCTRRIEGGCSPHRKGQGHSMREAEGEHWKGPRHTSTTINMMCPRLLLHLASCVGTDLENCWILG